MSVASTRMMKRISCLFSLLMLLVVPRALAQSEVMQSEVMRSEVIQSEDAHNPEPPTRRVVGLAFAGGLGGALVGAGVNTLGALLGVATITDVPSAAAARVGFGVMHTLTFAPLTSAGVFFGGRAGGGRGRYDLTLLGGTLGAAVSGLFALGAIRNEEIATYALIASPITTLLGSVLAYYLSHRAWHPTRPQRMMLGPTAHVQRGGGSLGLSGSF